ncbi:MAG: YgiQ family radical SAM protein [Thermodesulfobacteriota bacterium]|nr:YgiQ family radical SAM protein [Thermodesulfobacteriota bacterium]
MTQNLTRDFLPATGKEMRARGWDFVDVVLVTGDAYIDHPSFGIALIGRLLEHHGYRVAILSQPRYDSVESFHVFGKPRLFWGITAGNLDSIVANYTGNGRVREQDSYSKDGNPYFGSKKIKTERRRPDRAVTRYANLARAAYKNVPVVLGGLEASLRRFVHFDYQQNRLRGSALADAKADILVYGMGETAILEIARRISTGKSLDEIPGTCIRLSDRQKNDFEGKQPLVLPSWQEIREDKKKFLQAELILDKQARSSGKQIILQKQQGIWVAQYPPQPPLKTAELDRLYSLPFVRGVHPVSGRVPAWNMIRHSLTIVRGCSGNCSFCAISRHQGPVVTSRSRESILAETSKVVGMADFKGTISDLGGPTANLYGVTCAKDSCRRHDCLYDHVCPHLRIDESAFMRLLKEVSAVPGVKHVYVSSGLRMELLLKTPKLLAELLNHHTPGAMKIAPEHTESHVLRLMHKQKPEVLPRFLKSCRKLTRKTGKKIIFNPYIISAHPGCTERDMKLLSQKMKKLGLTVKQLQDFTPTPGTLSTAMFVSGLDRDTLEPVFIPKGGGERRRQRKAMEENKPFKHPKGSRSR